MKRASSFSLFVVFLATAITCFGQAPDLSSENSKGCDPSGTWYGGSGDMSFPYKLSIEPMRGGRYSVMFEQAISYADFGLIGWTAWTGEMTLRPGQKYELFAVAFFVISPDLAPSYGGSLDIDATHATVEFSDNCNVIQHTIDTYIGYIPWTAEKVPFVTNTDWNWLELIGLEAIVETYYRMPTVCPNCPFAGAANSVRRLDGAKLRGKKR